MASTRECEYCGAPVRSDEKTCSHCGAANNMYIADTPRTVFLPKTIEELKEYCAERGMPLQRMRFFIGEDYQHPKAFGIFQAGDQFIVYKNKANGSRAVRYHGPDEAYAVNELFAKLLEECHNRGIYPDGKPEKTEEKTERNFGQIKSGWSLVRVILVVMMVLIAAGVIFSFVTHRSDGYYRFNNDTYYRYGNRWYEYDSLSNNWIQDYTANIPENVSDYYVDEESFESEWTNTSFKESDTWRSIQESYSSSSSDYDSWDSSDTDWDSDW